MLYLLSADTRKFILRTDPLRASLGPGGTTVTHGAPCKLPHPRGIAGPSDTAGPGVAFPLTLPLDGPASGEQELYTENVCNYCHGLREPERIKFKLAVIV